jgi:bacteriocin biosynthesis cyclodehydratase domain-containing protein
MSPKSCPAPATVSRPLLKAGLRQAWRAPGLLQFGLDPERAVVIEGVDSLLAGFLVSLDGSLDEQGALQLAQRTGVDTDRARAALDVLAEAGLLADAGCADSPTSLSLMERDRMAPDLRASALGRPSPSAGPDAIHARRHALVAVIGAGRVGTGVAALLGAAGVGMLVIADDEPALASDITPFGLSAHDIGRPRFYGARRVLAGAAPSTRVLSRIGSRPDLVVLAPEEEADRASVIRLVSEGVPHLLASVSEAAGTVGPFVVPGETACLHCIDLHRSDLDPAWPALLAQTVVPGPAPASDVALAGVVASLAVLHVTTFLTGDRPSSMGGTLTIGLDGSMRRRTWPPHPGCGCRFEHLAERAAGNPESGKET